MYSKSIGNSTVHVREISGMSNYTHQRIENNSALMVVYSVSDRSSFEKAQKLLRNIRRRYPGSPTILVGNKTDLQDEREISFKEGSDLSQRFHCKFVETSAKNNVNVSNAFNIAIYKSRRDCTNHVVARLPYRTHIADRQVKKGLAASLSLLGRGIIVYLLDRVLFKFVSLFTNDRAGEC